MSVARGPKERRSASRTACGHCGAFCGISAFFPLTFIPRAWIDVGRLAQIAAPVRARQSPVGTRGDGVSSRAAPLRLVDDPASGDLSEGDASRFRAGMDFGSQLLDRPADLSAAERI